MNEEAMKWKRIGQIFAQRSYLLKKSTVAVLRVLDRIQKTVSMVDTRTSSFCSDFLSWQGNS